MSFELADARFRGEVEHLNIFIVSSHRKQRVLKNTFNKDEDENMKGDPVHGPGRRFGPTLRYMGFCLNEQYATISKCYYNIKNPSNNSGFEVQYINMNAV